MCGNIFYRSISPFFVPFTVLCFLLTCIVPSPDTALAVNPTDAPTFKAQISTLPGGTVPGAFYKAGTVAIDSSDNVYIGDGKGNISKYNASGQFLLHWGGPGANKNGNGEFAGDVYLAINTADGTVYVADGNNNRIQKFDAAGNYLSQFGSQGSGDGQLYGPAFITTDASGNLYVSENHNFRVQKFDPSGHSLLTFGTMGGTGNGQFNTAQGIAVDASGSIYVADQFNNRIEKFDAAGHYLSQFGVKGSGAGQLNQPMGIAIDPENNLYVADSGNDRIQKFTVAGTFISTWGSYGTGESQFNSPNSIAFDSSHNVYVADSLNNRVSEFNAAGVFIKQWGGGGTGNGQLNGGGGLAKDGSGNLYVVDIFNHRVQKFDAAGHFVAQWGGYGSGNGQLSYPIGITVDSANNVYVAEQGNSRVQKFDSSGHFVTTWGSFGTGSGQFDNPVSMFADASNNIYVADSNNRRIQKFDSSGHYLSKWTTDGSISFGPADGIAVDASGNLYVTDYECHVHKFTAAGAFLARWGSCGNENGKFHEPVSVAVDSQGYVYVLEAENNRVQKFDSSGNYLAQWGGWGTGNGKFVYPLGLSIDSADNIYVADMTRVQVFGYASPTPTPGASTLTAYPTVDGEIDSLGGATYATSHNAASGTGLDAGTTATLVAANTVNGSGLFNVKRALLNFDTSALPDNAVISAVTLKLSSTGPVSVDADAISIVGNTGASNNSYAVADFNKFGATKYAGDIPFLSLSGGGYNTFTFNATGIAAINLTGITKLGVRTARDIANTAPNGANYVFFTAVDAGSTKPTLTITYTVPTL